MIDIARHVALLAPVPLEHLLTGADVANREGHVAFGSRAWELFRELDGLRRGMSVDTYIYASQTAGAQFDVSWHGCYVGHVDAVNGAHPAGMRYRPPSTAKYLHDNEGFWAVFWEIQALGEFPVGERIPLSVLVGFGKKRPYRSGFIPEGPVLIEHPG
jgi:hypothetical protein